ncbi:MAG TPA: AgmX/PglI C-terminal domain-containing protein [Polyangiaceae bacterium]
MSESIAPSKPPQSSSGAIYIIAVIALIAAIGGLVFWKVRGANDAAVMPPPPPVMANPTPLLEPPPPPPIAEEDLGRDGGGVKTAGNLNPCTAKCSGTGNNAMNAALSARAGSARPCYERALRVNSALQGKLMVNVRIDSQGNVCSASISDDAMHSPEVSNCVMGMFRSARFPPPTGGCIDAKVPLSFVPREGR